MGDKYQNSWIPSDYIHKDLLATKNLVYDPCKLKCSQPVMEAESTEYGAFTFKLNDSFARFRVAKITPTKVGQFVTLWKRVRKEPIQPYDVSDTVDFLIVCTRKEDHFGQFVFPKSALCEQGVLSVAGKEGKRAIRVYPPWDKTQNRHAQTTQKWQMRYFLDICKNEKLDYARAQMLYSQK